MKTEETGYFNLWVSYALAVLVALTSVAGLFWAPTYAQETPLWAAQGMGGDAVNLVLVVPVLLVSAMQAHRGSVPARLVWIGSLFYLLYNFVIAAFFVLLAVGFAVLLWSYFRSERGHLGTSVPRTTH